MAAYVEDQSVEPGDTPSDDNAYGFVKWDDQPDKFICWVAGYGDDTLPADTHPTERWAPYLFPGNGADPSGPEVVEAWDLLVSTGLPGFPSADTDQIRLVVQRELAVFPREFFSIFPPDEPVFVQGAIDG